MGYLTVFSSPLMAASVVFIGIAFDTSQAGGTAFIRRYGITYVRGLDTTTKTTAAYGLAGIPDTIFIDRSGIVAQKIVGPITQKSLAAGIQALLR
jgi:cytochrome c biogenesis protein CcmG/thiol:disulfide interchange protein DsbE